MTDTERKIFRSLISTRQEIAYNRLKENTRYTEVCKRQRDTDVELDEVYIQGLQDCVRVLSLIGVFNSEMSL